MSATATTSSSTREELEAVALESKPVIDIDEFVPKKDIDDERYLNNPY
jgi:non-homologous end joining protein Ku